MDQNKALEILSALAGGTDPEHGSPLPPDHCCQSPQVVRALFVAVRAMEAQRAGGRSRATVPQNAGKPWTAEEDVALLKHFDGGMPVAEIAGRHGRTAAGIQARLERHGRLQLQAGNKPSYFGRAVAPAQAPG